jgi:hypothetical protein
MNTIILEARSTQLYNQIQHAASDIAICSMQDTVSQECNLKSLEEHNFEYSCD